MKERICIYFKTAPEKDRFFIGDRYIRPLLRKIFRKKRMGGVEKVFLSLCKSFDVLNVKYIINNPFENLKKEDKIIILGTGKHVLKNYKKPNKIIAGIGLMTHPSEWPDLANNYPIAKYLQHSEWAKNVYVPFYGNVCDTWPTGIDTDKWVENRNEKKIDLLIYNKIRWNKEQLNIKLVHPIKTLLQKNNISFKEITYGNYYEDEYKEYLKVCKGMIFLCEHESQGIACCEALSCNIPVFAWDNGWCLDPNRFKWGDYNIPATSVPFFDERCGLTFKNINDFQNLFLQFINDVKLKNYKPREFIMENLTLEKSGLRMLQIIEEVYS